MTKFRYVARHPDTLANGRPVGPGEEVSLDSAAEKQPHNRRLVDAGALIQIKAKSRSGGAEEGDDQ